MSAPAVLAAFGLACLASTVLLIRRAPARAPSVLDLDTVYA